MILCSQHQVTYDDQIVESTFKKSVLPGYGLYPSQARSWDVGRKLSLKYAVH